MKGGRESGFFWFGLVEVEEERKKKEDVVVLLCGRYTLYDFYKRTYAKYNDGSVRKQAWGAKRSSLRPGFSNIKIKNLVKTLVYNYRVHGPQKNP